jgi:DNA primase
MASPFVELEIDGRTVKVSNPDKIFYRKLKATKLDHVQYYYVSVGEGIVRALYERPTYLKRHPDGADDEPIYQKRVPEKRPTGSRRRA